MAKRRRNNACAEAREGAEGDDEEMGAMIPLEYHKPDAPASRMRIIGRVTVWVAICIGLILVAYYLFLFARIVFFAIYERL